MAGTLLRSRLACRCAAPASSGGQLAILAISGVVPLVIGLVGQPRVTISGGCGQVRDATIVVPRRNSPAGRQTNGKTGNMSDLFVSPLTAATIVVGAVIAIFYLRNMWLVLQRTAATLDEPDDKRPDAFAYSFAGAVVAVVASWLAIAAYGVVAGLPLCRRRARALASPIAVGYTFYRELRD